MIKELKVFDISDIPQFLEDLSDIDDKFLLQMAGSGYSLPLTTDQIVRDILSDDHLIFKFVDDEENRVIGYCQLTKIEWKLNTASIGRVVIKNDFRNQGYSSKMLNGLMDYARHELNIKTLYLRVFDFNIPALKCYNKLGFNEANSEKIYYTQVDETWNCITMKKNLA